MLFERYSADITALLVARYGLQLLVCNEDEICALASKAGDESSRHPSPICTGEVPVGGPRLLGTHSKGCPCAPLAALYSECMFVISWHSVTPR